MLLGAVMTALRDEDVAVATLMELGDILLLADVETARRAYEESVGEYLTGAVQRFARSGSDEDWLALMGALERSETLAETCLAAMLRWSLARDAVGEDEGKETPGCSCGGGARGRHDHW